MIIINNCVLIGRLTKDPELRYLPNGNNTAVANFTLAVDRNLSKDKKEEAVRKGQPTADFINITAWGKTAELVNNYLNKGSQVAVQGRIQTGRYEKDGQMIYTTDVIAERVEFLGGRGESKQPSTDSIDGWDNYGQDIPF